MKPSNPSRRRSRFAEACVVCTKQITPHMIRVTFRSEITKLFPENIAGAHLKLVMPHPDEVGLPDTSAKDFKTRMRTYTLREVRPSEGTFDVDFVVHGDVGIAGPWAARAKPGDLIAISQPGAPKLVTSNADWFLIAADMSAIPAAAAGLATLEDSAIGDAFFEILSEEDRQPVRAPSGINVHWIVKTEAEARSEALIDAVRYSPWRPGEPSVFVAGEFSMVGELRRYFVKERRTQKQLTYISSYWKLGLNEPGHRVAKDMAA